MAIGLALPVQTTWLQAVLRAELGAAGGAAMENGEMEAERTNPEPCPLQHLLVS
jgi:hypothetical protein